MTETQQTINNVIAKMIAYSDGNKHDIAHFLKVYTYARMIGEMENLTERKQEILERFESLVQDRRLLDAESYMEKKRELEQRLDEYVKKYTDIRKKQSRIRKRMVCAYPELKSQFRTYREKHQKKKTD